MSSYISSVCMHIRTGYSYRPNCVFLGVENNMIVTLVNLYLADFTCFTWAWLYWIFMTFFHVKWTPWWFEYDYRKTLYAQHSLSPWYFPYGLLVVYMLRMIWLLLSWSYTLNFIRFTHSHHLCKCASICSAAWYLHLNACSGTNKNLCW